MMITSRVLAFSVIAAVAASSLFFVGRYAAAESPAASLSSQPKAVVERSSREAARIPLVKVTTHVLLVSRVLLEEVEVKYDLKIPMHHVRPDTAETLTDAALISESTAGQLLKIANAGPQNLEFSPEPEVYPDGEDEFDCLSEMFRG